MAATPTSKSQTRTMAMFALECDGTYEHATRVLENAGLPGDGVPRGHTWRSMKKLSDAELLAALPSPTRSERTVATTREVRAANNRGSWYQQAKARAAQPYEAPEDEEDRDLREHAAVQAQIGQSFPGMPGEGSEAD